MFATMIAWEYSTDRKKGAEKTNANFPTEHFTILDLELWNP